MTPTARRDPLALLALCIPLLGCALLVLVPLAVMVTVSFWERRLIGFEPALSLEAYRDFFSGVRLQVLFRSLGVAGLATALMLALAYPVAFVCAYRLPPRLTRLVLFLLAVPFLVNYIIRTFSWAGLLARNGAVNRLLQAGGLVEQPLDWLLFSDFAVYMGMLAAYMPFMVYPIWLSLSTIDRRLVEASWTLGEGPLATFLRVVLPLSLPGVAAALIFGFVSAFGEVAVPVILGGVGYQLLGNTITSSLDVLNYPLAAAMSTVAVLGMVGLLVLWLRLFDLRLFLGRVMGR